MCITTTKKTPPQCQSFWDNRSQPQPENSLPCLSFPQPQLQGIPRVAPWHGEQLISYKSYVKKVNLNVSDAEAHSPLPHILSQLAFECKILPDRPPEHSNSFTSAKNLGKKRFGTQGPDEHCSTTHGRSVHKVCVGITFTRKREGAVTRGGGRQGSGSAAGREGLAPAGRTPKAPGPPPAPGQREPRTAPWTAREGALRPLAAGPVPVRCRPPAVAAAGLPRSIC